MIWRGVTSEEEKCSKDTLRPKISLRPAEPPFEREPVAEKKIKKPKHVTVWKNQR
jgi:hypothetical protein